MATGSTQAARPTTLWWLLVACLLSPSATVAGTLHYDFASGLGAGLSVVNDGGLFAVAATGGALRVDKPADGGVPPAALRGGVVTDYLIDGDFSVITRFDLSNGFPFPGEDEINSAQLELLDGNGTDFYSVLRFRLTDGAVPLDLLEAFGVPPGAPLGLSASAALTGRFRLSRVGGVLRSEFDAAGGGFTPVDERNPSTLGGAVRVRLSAVQNGNLGVRSTTALDIRFDDLIITADRFIGVPVPGTLLLMLFGLGAAVRWQRIGNHTEAFAL